MRKTCGLVLLLVLVWIGWGWAGGPQLQIGEPSHDFGVVMEGETFSHDFIVLNPGDETLQIKDVRPG